MPRLFLLAVLSGACTFRSELPSGAIVTCVGNSDCPRGTGCRQPIGRCESAFENDALPASVVRAVVSYTTLGLPPRIALGPSSRASIEVEVSEPLSNAPVLSAGPTVVCSAAQWRNDTLQFECTTAGSGEGSLPLELSLVDLAGNTAAVTLPVSLEVDGTPPSHSRTSASSSSRTPPSAFSAFAWATARCRRITCSSSSPSMAASPATPRRDPRAPSALPSSLAPIARSRSSTEPGTAPHPLPFVD